MKKSQQFNASHYYILYKRSVMVFDVEHKPLSSTDSKRGCRAWTSWLNSNTSAHRFQNVMHGRPMRWVENQMRNTYGGRVTWAQICSYRDRLCSKDRRQATQETHSSRQWSRIIITSLQLFSVFIVSISPLSILWLNNRLVILTTKKI